MAHKPVVLVCVTGQKTCERLIRAGAAVARPLHADLSVVHVARKGFAFLGNPKEGEALEFLYEVSKAEGADMTVLRADDVPGSLQSHAVKHGVTHIIIGASGGTEGADFQRRLSQLLPHVEIRTVYE